MKNVLVVAPHPDDETLGCGGTILRHIAEGDQVHWLIVTGMTDAIGYLPDRIDQRKKEIQLVTGLYGFSSVHTLDFPTCHLDQVSMTEIVAQIGLVFKRVEPTILYMPYRGDAHTDHAFVFDAVAACTKWFRFGSIKQVLAYETLSETDFEINPDSPGFRPNVFSDITGFLDKKVAIMNMYVGELGVFPFPRSEKAIYALAKVRGATSGCDAAEAFMLLREIR